MIAQEAAIVLGLFILIGFCFKTYLNYKEKKRELEMRKEKLDKAVGGYSSHDLK
jgi:hypothetical protein